MKEYLKDYVTICREIPLFESIREEEIPPLLECLRAFIKTYRKDEFILQYNDSVKCVGVVRSGSVHMIKEDLWGNKNIFAIMGKDELFGETFACGANMSSTVAFVAASQTEVLFLSFDHVLHTCGRQCDYHHRLIENMVRHIANKNVQLMEKLDIITKRTLREKVSSYLAMQAQHFDSKYFTIPMKRLELADYLCVNRSALTRELKAMKEEGLIDFEQNTFKILKTLY